jgi:cob(I)alamin adenosyltransferase
VGLLSSFTAEILLFLFFLAVLPKPALLALLIGIGFLTLFAYLVLLFYFQTKKPEQIVDLRDKFVRGCREILAVPQGAVEQHLAVSKAALRFVSQLDNYEYGYYTNNTFEILHPALRKLGAFLHKEDMFTFRELLLFSAISEHLEQIRKTPADLEIHSSLAQLYVTLFRLYLTMQKEARQWKQAFSKKQVKKLPQKFQKAALWAVEEFIILKEYSPNDPWVHAQLARSYRALERKEDEAKEYEELLQLRPYDYEILFRLGQIYFELGRNAQGLRIYEKLKQVPSVKASDLLASYGKDKEEELLEDFL